MSNTNTIYRDDDINVYTNLILLKEAHKKMIPAGEIHTVGVIMHDLWENTALFYWLLTNPYVEIALHGWKHKDYARLSYEECDSDLSVSLAYWFENATRLLKTDKLPDGKEITKFFSPWNHDGANIREACSNNNLKFCNVAKGPWEDRWIKSFHWWSVV